MKVSRRQLFGAGASLAAAAMLPKAFAGKQVFRTAGATTIVIPGDWPIGQTIQIVNMGSRKLIVLGAETAVLSPGSSYVARASSTSTAEHGK